MPKAPSKQNTPLKQNIPPGVMIAAIALVVLIIGFVAFRTLFKDPNINPATAEDIKQMDEAKAKSAIHQNMAGQLRGYHTAPATQTPGGK